MANINTYLINIKNALFGKDVRTSIHDGIDAINKEVEGTTKEQQKLSDTFKNLTINAGNSNAEIVAARGSKEWLPDRLDENEEKISVLGSQMEHIHKQEVNVKMFGAIGNDNYDNLNAFNETVNYCITNNIKKIIVPNGVYVLSDTFKLPSGFTLEGLGDVTLKQTKVNSPVLATKEYYENTKPVGKTNIKNINIIGSIENGVNNIGMLIWDYYTNIENCNVNYCGGNGIKFTSISENGSLPSGNLVENRISNCHVRYTNLTPVYIGEDNNNKLTDGIIENCMIKSNQGSECDLYIGSSAGWFVSNIHTYGSSLSSILLRNCYQTKVDNIYIENYIDCGINIHVQTNVELNNVGIKVQNTVSESSSAIILNKSGLNVGDVIVNINNLSLFNYVTSKKVNGVTNKSSLIKAYLNNYGVGGNNIENIIKTNGGFIYNENILTRKPIVDGEYTIKYDNINLKQYHIEKFSGNTAKTIKFKLPDMNNYSKLVGKINIYGNAYDNGTILTNYSSEVFVSAKNTSDELYIFNKELYNNVGFSSVPSITVNRTLKEITVTFTAADTRNTGVVSFEYCVV